MRTKALFLPILVLCLFLLVLSRNSVYASPSTNPVFATIQQVQQLISDALSPLQTALTSLGNRVTGLEAVNTTQTAHLSELDDRVASQSAQIIDLINHDTRTD